MKKFKPKLILLLAILSSSLSGWPQTGYLNYNLGVLPSNLNATPNQTITIPTSYAGIPNHSCGAEWTSFGSITFKVKLIEAGTLLEIILPNEYISFEGQNCNEETAFWSIGNINITLPCNIPTGNYYLQLQTFEILSNSIPGPNPSIVVVNGFDNLSSTNVQCQAGSEPCPYFTLTQLNITNNGTFTDIQINDLSQGCSASAEAIPLDGVGPYTYSWTSGITTSVANFSSPGNQQVTVSDAYGCTITESINLAWNNTLSNPTFNNTTSSCSINTGSSDVTVIGGFLPLSYAWSDGQNISTAINLDAGNYSLTITDNTGCQTNGSTTIDYPYTLNSSLTTQNACTYDEGAIFSTVSGGVAPYVYNWNEGENTADLIGIIAGTYSVTIIDANGCTTTESATLNTATPTSYFDYPNGLTITSPSYVFDDAGSDGIIRFRGPLIIKSGVNYSINNKILEFARNLSPAYPDAGTTHSGVIVEQKAKLTATNCTFKGVSSCDAMWQGIQVWGDDHYKTTIGAPVQPLRHGELILTNSTVQDAHIGVALYRVNVPYAIGSLDHGRGILKAKFSTFLNNRISVDFKGRSLVTNSSYIKECNFTCNTSLIDATKYFGEGSDVFIRLSKVKNPVFNGNTFNGNLAFEIDQRSTGIRSYDAGYIVQSGNAGAVNPSSPPVPNIFTNLSQGIDVYSTGGAVSTVRIKDNRFNNVYQGITASGSNFDEISFNVFNTPMGEMNFNSWAMFLNTSSGFLATENILNTLGTNQFTFGIVNKNVNYIMSKVYKNRFNGDYNTATQAEGTNNSKLQIDCNRYLGNNTFDWTVLTVNPGSMANQGVCNIDNTQAVINVFGECLTADESQIFSSTNFDYSTIYGFEPNCLNVSLVTVFPCGSENIENMCPQRVTDPCPSCVIALNQQLENTPPGLLRDKIKSDLVRQLAQNGDIQELVNVLTSDALPEDLKIIIPTHIQRKEFNEARILLNSLVQSDFENQKFYELFDVLTMIGETEREIVDITETEKLLIIDISYTNTQAAIFAESVLAELDKTNIIRFPEQILQSPSAMMILSYQDGVNAIRNELSTSFEIYPNPSQGNITIQSINDNSFSISIYDYSGRNIFETNSNDSKITITGLSTGVYTVEINSTEGIREIKKLFVQ